MTVGIDTPPTRVSWLAVENAPRNWVKILSREEQVRARNFRLAVDRDAYIAAHGLVRVMLAEATTTAPRDLRFTSSPTCKPLLADARGELHFSLSHSRRWVACAVAGMPIGIDVEAADRPIPASVLEQLAPYEAALVRALPEASAQRAFYRIWTLKEAVLKATGEGLRQPLASFSVSLDPAAILSFDMEPHRWHLAEFSAAPHYPVALAVLCPDGSPIVVEASEWNLASWLNREDSD